MYGRVLTKQEKIILENAAFMNFELRAARSGNSNENKNHKKTHLNWCEV